MVINICPHCNARYMVASHSGDFVHDCSVATSDALKQEDVVVVGNSEDYDGSNTVTAPNYQGVVDENWGMESSTRGDREVNKYTSRGANSFTHRQRRHLEYIENTADKEGH